MDVTKLLSDLQGHFGRYDSIAIDEALVHLTEGDKRLERIEELVIELAEAQGEIATLLARLEATEEERDTIMVGDTL